MHPFQVIRSERALQDERQQLRAARDEAAAIAQKHHDAMQQMGNRLAAAADAAAAAEGRAQACEREAAARALQDEGIMRGAAPSAFPLSRFFHNLHTHFQSPANTFQPPPPPAPPPSHFSDVRSSMAGQLHALTSKLTEAQRQLELRHQVDRDREADSAAAAAAAAATASAQREWLSRLVSAASGIGNTLARMSSDSENSRANQQVSALLRGRRHGQ
jgi:hypothetical protein